MQFVVHGHHLELTDALKTRCRTRIYERALKLVSDSAARLEVELSDRFGEKQRNADKVCKINLRAPGIPPIVVREIRPNMYEAIDLSADRLVEALKRALEKREGFRRDSIKDLVPRAPSPAPTTGVEPGA